MGITCKQAVDYISKKEEGKLSAAQRFRLWKHLVICRFSRAFNRQNRLLTSVFKRKKIEGPADETLNKNTIIDALQNAGERGNPQ